MSTKARDYVKDHVTSKSRDEDCHVIVRKRRRSEHDLLQRRRDKEAYIRGLVELGETVRALNFNL